MMIKKVSIIGLGYIGLPTAALIASNNIKVVGIDINTQIVDMINRGEVHFFEPLLEDMVKRKVELGYLSASLTPEPADVFIIAVPTPLKEKEFAADICYVEEAIKAVSSVLKSGDMIILESTSPVGTTEHIANILSQLLPNFTFPQTNGDASDIRIAYCPERIIPGKAIQELQINDRVIGGLSNRCSLEASNLYKQFVKGECVITNARTAEMTKLTENSFRDVNIAFANELSIICQKWGISVWELIKLANHHPRVNILEPGPGVGGHCIAVDPWFIISKAPDLAHLMRSARQVNDSKPKWVVEQIMNAISKHLLANKNKSLEDIVISFYGLAFKPDVDDLRTSPSINVIQTFVKSFSGTIQIVEPYINELPNSLVYENSSLVDLSDAVNADIHVLLVKHSEFSDIRSNIKSDSEFINIKGD